MAKRKEPAIPGERSDTLRRAIVEELRGGPLSAREIGVRVSLREKDVAPHLTHLERSLRAKGGRLVVRPALCLGCGYAFRDRRAFTKPGRCPQCRSERIEAATFQVEERADE